MRPSERQPRRRCFQPGQEGAALVELALVLPFLLILTLMVTELGRGIHQYKLITGALRDAVRYVSVQATGTHVTETQNLVVYGSTANTGTPLLPGLSTANVPAPVYSTAGTDPVVKIVTVSVTGFCFQPLVATVFGLSLTASTQACSGVPFSTISASMRAPS